MTTTMSYEELESILYMPLPDGQADVWLRKNIEQAEDEDGNTYWTADEVYFRTSYSKKQVEANFDALFDDLDAEVGELTEEEKMDPVEAATLTSRVEELEEIVTKLVEVEIEAGNMSEDDIPEGSVRDAVKADTGGGLTKDFP